jgi:hypothetical protein
MNGKLEQAIEAIKAGDKQAGRELIAEILKVDRDNEQAWLWVTKTDITHEQKIKSLKNVLRINPDNETARQKLTDQSSEVISNFIAKKSSQGWQVVNRTDNSVQMRKPKQWNRPTLIIGFITAVIGLGLLILLLAVLDYAFKREKVAFVTVEQLRSGNIPEAFYDRDKRNTMQMVIAVLILGVVGYGLCYWAFALM